MGEYREVASEISCFALPTTQMTLSNPLLRLCQRPRQIMLGLSPRNSSPEKEQPSAKSCTTALMKVQPLVKEVDREQKVSQPTQSFPCGACQGKRRP
ncbi:hypothetical protein E2C01_011322 [Portunus trituberculatus]|uniref:Uncharacterized protein n=1 Tax=Portunus trituberculatus TaxID=210409 RepID=A0A5B7DAZ6_PORTR|nr:hypothetical protein [Portunus trituberculatus]